MAQNPYLKPPAFYVGRGHGKTMLHLLMCLEYLKICDMFEHLNKYRGVALPKVDLIGVVREYYQRKKSQYEFKLTPLHPECREQLDIYRRLNPNYRPEDEYSIMTHMKTESIIKMIENGKQAEEIAGKIHTYFEGISS